MKKSPFARKISVRALDVSGELAQGTEFEWYVNSQPAGTSTTDGHGTLELDGTANVSVLARYRGTTLGPVSLAEKQDWYDFHFDVRIHSNWWEFFLEHFPAIVGVSFITAASVLAFSFQNPSALQTHIMLALFALGGGGFGGEISGFISTDIKLGRKLVISAGGAAAIFALLYFFVPAN